ncbi:MAG: recombinase family protein [Actinobacteria bacterium]|nr:recombinase family protein [Actinomycetota bacterium]
MTAPIVQRIFDEYLADRGYFAIAERLTGEGIDSPSGHDRERNRHRHGLAWGKSAIRAILSNPRYTGYQVWAKQRREEVLLDVEDVSAGHQTVMRWNGEEQWVWSAEPVHEGLVSMETFRAVQARMIEARSGGKPRQGRKTERPYLLRGRLTCGLCGRRLQGSWHHGEPYYRCSYGAEYALSAKLDHPKVIYLRERDVLPHVDAWLSRIFDPEHVDETCEAVVGAIDTAASTGERAKAAALIRECDRKLDRYRALLEAGTEPGVVAGWISEVEGERRRAQAVVHAATRETVDAIATAAEVRQVVEELGGLVGLLDVSEPKLRSRFYEEIGFTGTYDPNTRTVEALADIGVRKVRVGGGT